MTLHTFADGSIGPLNHPSPFDAAWRTRVPSSWPSDDQPKRRMGSSSGWDCRAYSPIGEERKAALAAMTAKARDVETAAAAKPFRFEDLNGQPEPKTWGPVYPTLPGVEKWRKLERKRELTPAETREYGASVGAAIRALQYRELCGARPGPIDLRCTARGIKYGPGEEEAAYQRWLMKLATIRAARPSRVAALDAVKPARKLRKAA